MNLRTVFTLAIATALAAPVLAQTSIDKPAATAGASASFDFTQLDRNNDGYVSRDEARDAAWNTRFSEFDRDNDGRLSRMEFDAMQSAAGGGAPATSPSESATGEKPAQKR